MCAPAFCKRSKEDNVIRDVARIRTLTVLRRLDSERKGVVLKFLCEAGLLNRGGWHVVLGGGDLRGANLSNAMLKGIELGAVDLRGADLSGANLMESSLRQANLSGANLSGTIFIRADLRRADLSGVDLKNAWMIGAQLNTTNLRGADLSGANLSETTMYGDVSGADLTRADVVAGALEAAKSLTGATMPDGSKHE